MCPDTSRRGARLPRVLLLAAALSVFAVLPAASATTTVTAKVKTVSVVVADKSLKLASKKAPAGTVAFVVRNTGKAKHSFRIAGKTTPVLAPGKKAKLVVKFTKAGKYPYLSTVKGDAAKGLKGVFAVTAPPAPAVPGNAVAGKAVFKTTCGTCHTFSAAGTQGQIGPNLDASSASYATIIKVVTSGKSGAQGAMPSFGSSLTADQIQDVAAFVYTARGH